MEQLQAQQTVASRDQGKTYQIGGRSFIMLPVVARQEKWLWPILKPLFSKGETIEAVDIVMLLGESITRIAAILLIPEGQSQAEKVRAGWTAVSELEGWLDESVSVAALGPVIGDFFASGQQWRLLQGLAGPLPSSLMTGSTRPSAPSPTETSSELSGSGRTSDLLRPSAISSGAGNDGPPSGRS